MKYLLMILTLPFLFGFCQIGTVCQPFSDYSPTYQPLQPMGPPMQSFSNTSPYNPYATNPPKIYSEDGTYLGQLSANPYLKDSTSNHYGQYGNKFSPNSIHNPFGTVNSGGY